MSLHLEMVQNMSRLLERKEKTKRSYSILNLKGQGLFAPRALCCPLGARALFHMQPLDSPPPGFFSILRAHVPASVRLPCRMIPAVNATMRRTVARGSWDLWILLGFNWARELKRNLGILLQAVFWPSTDVCMEGPETTCHTDVPIAGCHPNPTKPRIVLPFLGGQLETRRLWCVMCTNRNMSTNWPLSALMCFACWQICLPQPWPSQIFLLLPLVLWLWCSTKSPHIHIQHWDWKSKQMPFLEAHHKATSNDSRDKMQQKAGSISHFSATRAGSAQGLSIWLYLSSPH